MFDIILDCWERIPGVVKHYFAYLRLEKKLLGCYKYKYHDLDKLAMYIFFPFLGRSLIRRIHRSWCRHHIINTKSPMEVDYLAAMIDWECCRFTKPNEPMTAREYLEYAKDRIGQVHYELMDDQLKQFNL